MYISLDILVFEGLNKLTNCNSVSKKVNEYLKISDDALIDKGQLILNTLNVN